MKIKPSMKKLAIAFLLSVSCFAANADSTTLLGPIEIGVPKSFSGLVAVGPFTDVFTFTLPPNSGSGYSVEDFTLFPATAFTTFFSKLTLISDADGSVAAGLGFGAGPGGHDEEFIASADSVGGGSISLKIPGNPGGNGLLVLQGFGAGYAGGIYIGAISASAVTSVAEPENYAMFLAGLGVMGAIAMRRNKSKLN